VEKASYLKKAYDTVLQGIERCKTKAMLWQLQGKLEQSVGTFEGAQEAFRKALQERPSDVVTRLLYAKLLENKGKAQDAINSLRDGLASAGSDRRLHHRLGLLLFKYQPSNEADIETNLKAAVMVPSNDYMPRFHLACFLFQTGKYPEAYDHFGLLNEIEIPRSEAYEVRWNVKDASGNPRYFIGRVADLGYDFGFIACEFPRDIYFSRWSLAGDERRQIKKNSQVHFSLGFTLRGPIALGVKVDIP